MLVSWRVHLQKAPCSIAMFETGGSPFPFENPKCRQSHQGNVWVGRQAPSGKLGKDLGKILPTKKIELVKFLSLVTW